MKKYVIARGDYLDILLKEINLYVKMGYVVIPPIIEEKRKHAYMTDTWRVLMELQNPGDSET